jgi:mannose-6-phosphate isomerase-like protein (cupin superfamily)
MNKSFIGKETGEPFVAKDGALIFELFRGNDLNIKNMGIASGYLKPKQKAFPHFHHLSEEIYFVVSGSGKVRIGGAVNEIEKGEAAYIPAGAIHALENTSQTEEMKILAICSPPYQDEDTVFI